MESKNKYHKTQTIYQWKYKGVIYDDWDELYYVYMNTLNCSHCNKEFKNSLDRHLDHDHSTGLFRAIVCQKCNCHDSYIKYPDGYDKTKYDKEYYENNNEIIKEKTKEYRENNKKIIKEKKKNYYQNNKQYFCRLHKEYREANKEKKKKYNKEYREANKEKHNKKYTCECGGKYTHEHKTEHLKTIKHTAWFMEQVD